MAMKSPQKKTYTSMRGKNIDLDLLRKRNELTPAVGNARVNARGDELGPGGKIVRSRENVVKDYYQNNPSAVPNHVKRKEVTEETAETLLEETENKTRSRATSRRKKEEESSNEWIEDSDGNYVRSEQKTATS